MIMRRFVLSALLISLIAVSSTSFASPIATERIRIWQEEEQVCLALLVPGLPNTLDVNKKQTPPRSIEYVYSILFFDGARLYRCGAVNVTAAGLPEQTIPLTKLEQTLFQFSDDGSNATLITHVGCHAEGEELIWTVRLPVRNRDGAEVAISFETITHIGIDIFDEYHMLSEQRSYRLAEDGSAIDLGGAALSHVLYPRNSATE